MVQCPKCDGTYPIIDGVSSMPIGGRMPAVEGMMTACGAVLIASQSQFRLEQVGTSLVTPAQYQAAQVQAGQSLVAGSEGKSLLFDSQFTQDASFARIFTVTAGHTDGKVSKDRGASGNGYNEADLVAELRNLVVPKLEGLGHTVRRDGEGDENWTLDEAIKLIPGSDVAIELHFNAGGATSNGVETISLLKDKPLAQQFSQAVAKVLNNAKVRRDNGWMPQEHSARGKLGYIGAGGLILEICFISNKTEMETYVAKKEAVADAIVKVLNDWAIVDEMEKQLKVQKELLDKMQKQAAAAK